MWNQELVPVKSCIGVIIENQRGNGKGSGFLWEKLRKIDIVKWGIKSFIFFAISLIVGLASEFASYSYCIFGHGIRPTLEGTSYLRLTVIGLTFVFWLALQVCFEVGSCIVRYAYRFETANHKVSLWLWLLVAIPFVLIGAATYYFRALPAPAVITPIAAIFGVGMGVAFEISIIVQKQISKETFSIILSVFTITVVMLFLFTPSSFGRFLKLIKYGGEIDVVIEYEESGGAKESKVLKGKLLIRSKEFLVLETEEGVVEINSRFLRSVNYPYHTGVFN